ncbi:MAG TPA: substrate-binding domain-containing protein [Roseiflexaceae bacterium]|nr:substrate-binding domain-containing protein [Roseiflexaceae bacterium]
MAARAHTGTIGFLAPTVAGTYFRNVLAGVYRVARQRGLRLLVFQALPQDVVETGVALDQVDGWVAVFATDGAERLARVGAPVVTVTRPVPGLPAVLSDNTGGMRAAVQHLIALGHRRIAFAGSATNSDVPERLAGYRMALEEAGLPFDDRLVFTSSGDHLEGGRFAGRAMLAAGVDYTAIAAATDQNALGIMEVLGAAGYRFPQDLAIVGFDDMPEAQVSSPPLTTVRLRFEELGRVAALQLLTYIADPSLPPAPTHVATALVVRRSCGAPAASTAGGSAPALPDAGGQDERAMDGWRHRLARRLAETIQHPLPLPADTPPEEVWPGVTTLVDALDAALAGAPPPDDAALQRVWEEATAIAAYADACGDALTALERTAQALLDAMPPYRRAPERVAAALAHLRSQLLRVCLGANARQLMDVEGSYEATHAVNVELSNAGAAEIHGLGWLRWTSAAWGCLGLWEGAPGGQMRLAGAYRRPGVLAAAGPVDERGADGGASPLAPSAFPPLDLAPRAAADVVLLIRIRTPRRDWGVLALGTSYGDRLSYLDSSRSWAGMLGARLDDVALMADLAQQRADLQEAYERARALADTVRELGSPVIPLGGGALLVPLIGTIDSARAQQVIEAVLGAVSAQRALHVLLDVTGVPIIDTHVAAVLLQLAQMLRLLGARATLVGVRPEIAQSIVSLGVDLRALNSHASLENALREVRHH